MKTMNLQARKLDFIQEILNITDVGLFSRLENLLKAENEKTKESEPTPMSMQEFYSMINQSLADANAGRVIDNDTLKRKVEEWH